MATVWWVPCQPGLLVWCRKTTHFITRKISVILGLALLFLNSALAEQWTVQTVAHRDYRNATSVQEELFGLGFDAYIDFAVTNNEQFARVRVGCFDSREAAQSFAQGLLGSVTREAVPVPLEFTTGTPPLYCLKRDIGFIVPAAWRQLEAGHRVVFEVTTLTSSARIVHDGKKWRLFQQHEDISALSAQPEADTNPFRQQPLFGVTRVYYQGIIIAHGELLWQYGNVAVVLEGDTVVAYAIDDF